MSTDLSQQSSFDDMGLIDSVMSVLAGIGFDTPTPIQTVAIPSMMCGRDILGQAQTGTGKTAAFALPILSRIDPELMKTQALVLVPTRELAIQLSDAFLQYSANMRRVSVLPVYGGADYREQFRSLDRGAHIVVGTPGRVMDHMRRGSLNLDNLSCLVLDEADEMLQMGFIDDIIWILEQTPEDRQTALFSATLPLSIRKIAQQHMKNPEEITVKLRTAAPLTINQRHIMVNHSHKVEALARIIESETYDGMLVFVRTKVATMELVEALETRGYCAEALNGDIKQLQRERTVERFKRGKNDILIATDVAARGLDVDRISHVINYDMPQDTDTYIHRVGRTGRAGRSGEAILFATHKERRMLDAIERATKQKITLMAEPSAEDINKKRIAKFKETLTSIIKDQDLDFFKTLLTEYQEENDVSALEVAAGLARQMQGDKSFLFKNPPGYKAQSAPTRQAGTDRKNPNPIGPQSRRNAGPQLSSSVKMDLYRIEVGYTHDVKPGNIVGAIANEAGINSDCIGKLNIYNDYSTVELPAGMPQRTFQILKKVWIGKRPMNISKLNASKRGSGKSQKEAPKKAKSKGKHHRDFAGYSR